MTATREHVLETPVGVLDRARELRAIADRAEAELLALAADWAAMHSAETVPEIDATEDLYGERPLNVAGPGAPEVAEFCVAEFALAIGKTTDAGRHYLGEALEVCHRLPGVRARLESGDLPAWRPAGSPSPPSASPQRAQRPSTRRSRPSRTRSA